MPRSFGSRSSSPSPSRSSTTAQAPPRQTVVHHHHHAPPTQQHASHAPTQVQQKQPGMFSGIGNAVVTGMAMGAGSEVAHQAIRGIMGGGSGHSQPQQQQQNYQQPQQQQGTQPAQQQAQQINYQTQQQACQDEMNNFSKCLQEQIDIVNCQPYMDILRECQKKTGI